MPKIAILLCTYGGQQYLPEQLASLEAQTHGDWAVWASDDGSRDGTVAILDSFAARCGPEKMHVRQGPRAGFVANFMSLVCDVRIRADLYAFSDQDDIWLPDKLERAARFLAAVPASTPALYCSRTSLIDANGNGIGLSPLYTRPPGFANALVQNIGSGNTMVFNDAARDRLMAAGPGVDVFAHDWWAYLLVSGCGGRVFYDPQPSLLYRQHGGNQIGLNTGLAAVVRRLAGMVQGRYRSWNSKHVHALAKVRDHLAPAHRETLAVFARARGQWLVPRLAGFWRSGIYRQTRLGNAGLAAAAMLNRI